MYIRLFSDIHNEFRRDEGEEPYHIPELPTDPQTVLVLAGDIDTKGRGVEYANALSGRFKAVVLVAGNHCIAKDTEVLTKDGWVLAEDITEDSLVATVCQKTNRLYYEPPKKVFNVPSQEMYSVKGDYIDELVSSGHHCFYKGQRTPVTDLVGEHHPNDFTYSGRYVGSLDVCPDLVALLTWVVMDGCLIQGESPNKKRIQFKLSKQRKITALRKLLDRMDVPYTFKPCKKSDINKLQPYYIRICGDSARHIWKALGGVKELPHSWKDLTGEAFRVLISTLEATDGHRQYQRVMWSTTSRSDVDVIQTACIQNGVTFSFSTTPRKSGFVNGKMQYSCTLKFGHFRSKLGSSRSNLVQVTKTGLVQDTVGVHTSEGTLVCRRGGKAYVTGNCYWGSNFTKLPNKWLEGSEDNVYPLFNAHITIDNVVFCGGTLWTDYNDCDELCMWDATRVMVDYSKIKSGESYRKFTPEMAYWDHKDCLKAIREGLSVQGARKYIVVTHMTPSYINEDPKFYNQYSTTKHYYHSNLDDLVCDADVWCFGHTHHNVDRIVGPKGTRMVSNQVGYYPDHLAKGFNDTLLIEV